eukprot:747923-Rhodomonas_salina.1
MGTAEYVCMSGNAVVRAETFAKAFAKTDHNPGSWCALAHPRGESVDHDYFRLIWAIQTALEYDIQYITIVHPTLQRDDKDPALIEDLYGVTRWTDLHITHLVANLQTRGTDGTLHPGLWVTLEEIKAAA